MFFFNSEKDLQKGLWFTADAHDLPMHALALKHELLQVETGGATCVNRGAQLQRKKLEIYQR